MKLVCFFLSILATIDSIFISAGILLFGQRFFNITNDQATDFFLNFAFLSPIWILIIFLVVISFLPKTMSKKLLLLILGFLILTAVILLSVFVVTDKNLHTQFLQKAL